MPPLKEDTLTKIARDKLGRFVKGNQSRLGAKLTQEQIEKITFRFKKGHIPWHKDKQLSEKHKEKLKLAHLGKKYPKELYPNYGTRGKESNKKGKTYEEMYGIEKAKELKEKNRLGRLGKKHSEKTRKKMSKSRLGLINIGENNGMWLGGKSFEPYSPEFNEELKEKIRARDNRECQYCHKKQENLPIDKLNRKYKLRVHHIDYNKKNNNPINLISLCNKCHLQTNGNRELWKRYFVMCQLIRMLILFNPQRIIKNQVRI